MEIIRQIWVVVIAIAAVVIIIVVATAVGAGGGRRHRRRGHHGRSAFGACFHPPSATIVVSLCLFCFGGKRNCLSVTFSEKVQNSSVRQQSPALVDC